MPISLETNLAGLEAYLKSHPKLVVKAAKRSMKEMLPKMEKAGIDSIRRNHYKIARKDIKKRMKRINRARGGLFFNVSAFNQLEAGIAFSNLVFPLIRFVTGKKSPRKQKNIPVAKRSKIKVQVRPGNKVRLDHSFITKGHGAKYQLFRRKGKPKKRHLQTVPSLAHVIRKDVVLQGRMVRAAQAVLRKRIPQNLKFFLDKAARINERKRSA